MGVSRSCKIRDPWRPCPAVHRCGSGSTPLSEFTGSSTYLSFLPSACNSIVTTTNSSPDLVHRNTLGVSVGAWITLKLSAIRITRNPLYALGNKHFRKWPISKVRLRILIRRMSSSGSRFRASKLCRPLVGFVEPMENASGVIRGRNQV